MATENTINFLRKLVANGNTESALEKCRLLNVDPQIIGLQGSAVQEPQQAAPPEPSRVDSWVLSSEQDIIAEAKRLKGENPPEDFNGLDAETQALISEARQYSARGLCTRTAFTG